jgi:hypothetical protein
MTGIEPFRRIASIRKRAEMISPRNLRGESIQKLYAQISKSLLIYRKSYCKIEVYENTNDSYFSHP